MKFDPNAAAHADSGIFGLPHSAKDATLVLIPVPWEATTSYGGGTSEGPGAILEASRQVDLYDLDVLKPYEAGIHLLPESRDMRDWNEKAKSHAARIIEVGGEIGDSGDLKHDLDLVNKLSEKLNQAVYAETKRLYAEKKIPGVVGGDHSVPFGALQAAGEVHPAFGVLHFDAHSDTRKAFEGFEWSHASIMRNVLDHVPAVTKLVQVGIRDLCEEEAQYTADQRERVAVFSDRDNSRRKMEGVSWAQISKDIVAALPSDVWISFDIDGFDPTLCPHTGTPVPGGLNFNEANLIFATLVKAGKKIIGFDLNEVAPNLDDRSDEWDANVGARLLYKLCGWTLASQGKAKLQ